MQHPAETPLRRLPAKVRDGVRVVRETGAAWLDGSEQVLFERMGQGLPLDSLSDELYATAEDWPQKYHLSPSRANAIRALDLPESAVVLEVGAGCGAITRYLGERCRTVDALEPTLARARVAARRTADLPGVAVHSADVEDLPDEPAYDVVVIVGVLEYVGGGGPDRTPYVAFLERLRRVLRAGGLLVVAIENPLGVKYLAGAPEDHSHRVFHSVEGYAEDGPARTFSRRTLAGLAEEAGFASTRILGAFPDYKLTRMVFDERLLTAAPELAVQIPRFPSPDWVAPRPALADEGLVWNELVSAGVGADFANSFLLVARTDGQDDPLWPSDRLASYFSMNRRRALQVEKVVRLEGEEVVIESRLLGAGSVDDLTVLPYSEPWTSGETLTERLRRSPDRLAELVPLWRRLLQQREAESGESVPFDVLPGNIQVDSSGGRIIDDEWRSTSMTHRDVVLRGSLLLARDLAAVLPVATWAAASGFELARTIAALAGEDLDAGSFEAAVAREAELQALVGGAAVGTACHDRVRADVERELRRSLEEPREGRREARSWDAARTSETAAIETRDILFATGAQLDEARQQLEEARARIEALHVELSRTRGVVAQLRGSRIVGAARRAENALRAAVTRARQRP